MNEKRGWRWLWEQKPAWLQAALAVIAIVGGLFVCLPFVTSTPPFKLLNLVLPEPLWGALYLVCGAFQLSCVFHSRAAFQTAAAMAGMMTWFYLSLITFWYDSRALAWLIYGLISLMWFCVLVRVVKVKEQ